MAPTIHKILAGLSACTIALSLFAYVYSFFGAPVDKIFPWMGILVLVLLALIIPMYLIEYPASKAWNWTIKEWARGMPRWVAPCSCLLGLIAVPHFIWFAVQTWPGGPEIVDGQYVLGSGGRILKILTPAEYFRLREDELRLLATFIILFYFATMTYWWFQRKAVGGKVKAEGD